MQRRLFISCFLFASLVLIGCEKKYEAHTSPVEFTGSLKGSDGKPMSGVVVNFSPQFNKGGPANAPVNNGTFNVKLIPGPYVWHLTVSEGKGEALLKGLPEKYKSPNEETKFEASSGSAIDLQVK